MSKQAHRTVVLGKDPRQRVSGAALSHPGAGSLSGWEDAWATSDCAPSQFDEPLDHGDEVIVQLGGMLPAGILPKLRPRM